MILRFLKDAYRRLFTLSSVPGLIIGVGGILVVTTMLNITALVGLVAIAAGLALLYQD